MGYDPTFIPGCTIPFPTLSQDVRATAFRGGEPVEHTRFSLIFNQARGFAIITGHNIDGDTLIPEGRIPRRDRFRFDPDVRPNELQVDNARGYLRNPWDRGHLVRRRALHWGDFGTAEEADSQSFFWTNIAPQHTTLHASAWGRIEDWILELADDADKRTCIFTGPIFTPSDPVVVNQPGEEPFLLPAGFYKIAAFKHDSRLTAAAFLVWQRDFDRDEPVAFDPVLEQVRITTIEFLTGLAYTTLRDADPLRFGVEFDEEEAPARRRVRENSALQRAAAVTCAADIVL